MMFSGEVELGKFLGNIDVIPDAYQAILKTSETYKLQTTPYGIKVLAFNSPTYDYTSRFLEREFGLVSSQHHKVVDFISTKVNPKFSINKVAVDLFEHLQNDLQELKKKHGNMPLVVTGQGLGGYRAILFTLWLLNDIIVEGPKKKSKLPICITFGSPLIGDKALQHAISERPQWKSRFLNVVTKKDPVATFFTSTTLYKPFGTFLFCTDSGGHTTFEDHEAILAVLDDMALSVDVYKGMHDYGNDLGSVRRKVLYRSVSDESGEFNLNSLRAGIRWQFRELGVLNNISNDLIKKLEDKQEKNIQDNKNRYEPTRKLNDIKISMTFIEWYIKTRQTRGGYYDCYKNGPRREELVGHQLVITHHGILNQYWKKVVKDNELMPQKEGANLRKRWLLSGNNYRRMIEPLDIVIHYKNLEKRYNAEGYKNVIKEGNPDYIVNRSKHYELLERWLMEDKEEVINPSNIKSKGPNLNDDSCFWAHVEEAKISLRILKSRSSSGMRDDLEQKLDNFMTYVMREVNDYSVSSDIFLEGSSLRKWWDEYDAYKEGLCDCEFAQFMKTKNYKLYE